MFALVESSRTITFHDGWAGRAGSFLAHATLLTAALLLTRPAPPRADPRFIQTVYYPPHPAPTPLPPAPGTPGVTLPARPVFQLPTTPPVAAPNVPTGPAVPQGPLTDPGPGPVTGVAPAPPSGGWMPPRDAAAVDELPVLLTHPPIRYPELLRQAGVEGTVVVEVVLDTLGRVEPGSGRIVRPGHPLFEQEARAVVAASQYRPARLAGRAVRVRIQVPVVFAIRR